MAKELLKKILDGAVFALGAGAIVFLMVGTADYSRKAMDYLFQPHFVRLGDIKNHGLSISFHKQSPDTKNYTVVGSVKNSGEYHWKEINIQAIIMESGHVINRCGGTVNHGSSLNVGEEGFFRIKCYDMPSNNGSYTYTLKFGYGLAFDESS